MGALIPNFSVIGISETYQHALAMNKTSNPSKQKANFNPSCVRILVKRQVDLKVEEEQLHVQVMDL